MDSRSLVRAAYNQLIARAFELQTRIVMTNALCATFGDNALPYYEFRRTSLHHWDVLKNARESNAEDLERARTELAETLDTIREFEKSFANEKEADDAAFMEGLREYFKQKGRQ